MNKLSYFLIAIMLYFPASILARGSWGYGSGGDSVIGFILVFIFSFISVVYFYFSYLEWVTRRKEKHQKKEKEERINFFLAIIGYFMASLFASVPFVFLVRMFGGYTVVQQIWIPLVILLFFVLTYLRRT